MNDRELLEKAAKAAGIVCKGWCMPGARSDGWHGMYTDSSDDDGAYMRWNPLTDDGDALRLMARLNINVSYRENINGAWVVAEHASIMFCPESLDGPHEDVATRRAIVRAAAAMEEQHE